MPSAICQLPSAIFHRNRVRQHRERLEEFRRPFPRALDLGAHNGVMAEYIAGKNGAEMLVQSDLSFAMLHSRTTHRPREGGESRTTTLVADEEFLPFAEASFDLVISAGSLHWVNDLPGALIQIQRILKPGGLFLAMLPGGETLKELRHSFEQAEMAASGGISPRVSPFVDVRDGGSLLQRAGFLEPVSDSDIVTVSYPHPLKLLHDLRGMGETNAMLQSRKGFMPCSLMMLMVDHYLREFSDGEGRIPATFELVTLTGWKK